MYGASFDCGVEKTGDNHILKFYLESINNEFLPEQENLSKECMEILLDVVFNPYTEEGKFKQEYVDGEKENLKQITKTFRNDPQVLQDLQELEAALQSNNGIQSKADSVINMHMTDVLRKCTKMNHMEYINLDILKIWIK